MTAIRERFLLICHDRSGSNLLKGMLSQHPEIYVIPPLPVYEIIYPYRAAYGDLAGDANWDRLLDDAAALYAANHHPLPHPVTREELGAAVAGLAPGDRTLGAAVAALFDLLGEKVGRPVLGLKFGAQKTIVPDFMAETRFTRAVLQVRDPRCVALSVRKAGADPRSHTEFGEHWLDWHRTIRRETAARGMATVEHRYEDLLADPLGTLGRIWDFLGLPPDPGALDFHKADTQQEAARTSYMWENVAKPLNADNKEKFYAEWGLTRTREIEAAIGHDGLTEFGYAPAKLWRFPLRGLIRGTPLPERRVRTAKDSAFQDRQNALAAEIRDRWQRWRADARA